MGRDSPNAVMPDDAAAVEMQGADYVFFDPDSQEALQHLVNDLFLNLDLEIDIKQFSESDQNALRRIFQHSWYHKLIFILAHVDLPEKLLHSLFLRKSKVTKSDQKTRCDKDLLWPAGTSLLIQDTKLIKKVYAVTLGQDSIRVLTGKVWSAILFSLLANDLYNYYEYPDLRYGTTFPALIFGFANNQETIASGLTNNAIWPLLVLLPAVWGTIKSVQGYRAGKPFTAATLLELVNKLSRYQPHWFQDSIAWFLPYTPIAIPLYQIKQALSWDGRLSNSERLQLFKALKDFIGLANNVSHYQGLSALAQIAAAIDIRDFPRLMQLGVDGETINTLLKIKLDSIVLLKKIVRDSQHGLEGFENALNSDELRFSPNRVTGFIANYFLWTLGQSDAGALTILFWLYELFQPYAKARLYIAVLQGLVAAIEYLVAKAACEANNNVWTYITLYQKYACTTCGDLPVFLKDIYNPETCWIDAMSSRVASPAQNIVGLIKRGPWQNSSRPQITINLASGSLGNVLSALHQKAIQTPQLVLAYTPSLTDITDLMNYLIAHPEIQTLNLSGIKLSAAHTAIMGLKLKATGLQTLLLDNNVIDDNGAQAIIVGSHGSSLVTLSLRNNQLSSQSANTWILALKGASISSLDVSANSLGDVAANAMGVVLPTTNLTALVCSGTQLSDRGGAALVQNLNNAPRLTSLDLSYNRLSNMTTSALATGNSLQQLLLNDNEIDDVAGIAIGTAITDSLQLLDLSNNAVADNTATAIAQALPRATSFITLRLDNNRIGATGASALGANVGSSALTAISMNGNQIGSNGAIALAEGVTVSQVARLGLDSNAIGDAGFAAFADWISSPNALSLTVEHNGIGDVGIESVGPRFNTSGLVILSLSYNQVGSHGARILLESVNFNMDSLLLDNNQIGDAGFQAIGQVAQNATFSSLFLANNNITSQFVGSGVLQICQSGFIVYVDLSNNPLGDTGVQAIAAVLNAACNLNGLVLSNVSMTEQGAVAIAPALRSAKSLTSFWAGFNPIGNRGAQALVKQSQQQSLDLTEVDIDDVGADAIAQELVTTSEDHPANWLEQSNRDNAGVIAGATANTAINYLSMGDNKGVTTKGATVICKVLPQTAIPPRALGLNTLPLVDPIQVNPTTCIVASAAAPRADTGIYGAAYRAAKNVLSWVSEKTSATIRAWWSGKDAAKKPQVVTTPLRNDFKQQRKLLKKMSRRETVLRKRDKKRAIRTGRTIPPHELICDLQNPWGVRRPTPKETLAKNMSQLSRVGDYSLWSSAPKVAESGVFNSTCWSPAQTLPPAVTQPVVLNPAFSNVHYLP